ncbi:MAG TPA: hypothetical protein VFE74_06435 [Ramlibacter sp.]|jgi:hypothetical protein|nr:hypothetical protein [Ramlibacter sp.]
MLQKSLLILAIAAACATAQAQSTPAKKDYVARILKAQQPGIEQMARSLVQEPLAPLIDAAGVALQRVPADKREATARDIQADARKFADETSVMVRDRALKLAPTTLGPLLEQKLSEDELKQVAVMLESPALQKFQSMGGEIQRTLVEKVVAETRGEVEPRLKALEDSIGKRLVAGGAAPAAPAGKAPAKAPAKK